MAGDKDKKPEEEIESKVKEKEDGSVEVEIDEDPTAEPAKEKEPVAKEPDKKPDPAKEKSRLFYQERQINKMNKEIETLKTQLTDKKEPEVKTTDEEIDKAAQTDWKKAVDLQARETMKTVLEERDAKIEAKAKEEVTATELQKNNEAVMNKYGKELNDPSSDHNQIWWSILNSNPTWQKSPQGPLLVMNEMERQLRVKGYSIDGPVKEDPSKRVDTVVSTSLPGTRKVVTKDKVVITKEQRDFCDEHGIKYEDYARNLANARESEVEA